MILAAAALSAERWVVQFLQETGKWQLLIAISANALQVYVLDLDVKFSETVYLKD